MYFHSTLRSSDASRLPAYRLIVVVVAFLRMPSRIQAQACRVVVIIIAPGIAKAPPRASKDDRISFLLPLAVRDVLKKLRLLYNKGPDSRKLGLILS